MPCYSSSALQPYVTLYIYNYNLNARFLVSYISLPLRWLSKQSIIIIASLTVYRKLTQIRILLITTLMHVLLMGITQKNMEISFEVNSITLNICLDFCYSNRRFIFFQKYRDSKIVTSARHWLWLDMKTELWSSLLLYDLLRLLPLHIMESYLILNGALSSRSHL